jgi:prophage regulatory protein
MHKDQSGANLTLSETGGRWLRLSEVVGSVGFGRSCIYAKIKEGTFPAPIKIGPRVAVWSEAQIRAWKLDHLAKVRDKVNVTNGGGQ